MSINSKLSPQRYRKIFLTKDPIDSFLNRLEVITDSNAIIYSIRILIVILALLMGYIHTPKGHKEITAAELGKTEMVTGHDQQGMPEMK